MSRIPQRGVPVKKTTLSKTVVTQSNPTTRLPAPASAGGQQRMPSGSRLAAPGGSRGPYTSTPLPPGLPQGQIPTGRLSLPQTRPCPGKATCLQSVPESGIAGGRPQMKIVRSKSSITSIEPSGKKTVATKLTKQVTTPQRAPPTPVAYRPPVAPQTGIAALRGQYALPMDPSQRGGEYTSSPQGLREAMASRQQPDLRIPQGQSRNRQILQKMKPSRDILSGSFQVQPPEYGPVSEEDYYRFYADDAGLERPVSPRDTERMIQPRQQMPARTPARSPVRASTPPSVPAYMDTSPLHRQIEEQVRSQAAGGSPARGQGALRSPTGVPYILTPVGPQPVTQQMVLEKRRERSPEGEHISRHLTGIKVDQAGRAVKQELNMQNMQPGPSRGTEGVLQVTSSVSLTSDYRQALQSASLSHPTGAIAGAAGSIDARGGASPQEVSRLVQEEAEDVAHAFRLAPPDLKDTSPSGYPLRKQLQLVKSTEEMAKLHMCIAPAPAEAEEDVQPEILAAMMHTEEKGLQMGLAPTQLYNYLFPEADDAQSIGISSAAPAPLQDVVVPTSVPSELHRSYLTTELQQAALATQGTAHQPLDSIYSDSVMNKINQPIPNTANVARGKKKRKRENLVAEMPPWEDENIRPMINLVGAAPANTLVASEVREPDVMFPDASCGLEYILKPQPPQHISRVQLRGSQNPPWFPGFLVALPTIPDIMKITAFPDTVLNEAWRAVQPRTFPEDSMYEI